MFQLRQDIPRNPERAQKMNRAVLALLAALVLPACSTITEGASQGLLVATDPPGARCEVRHRGETIATIEQTPATVVVHKSPYDITVDCTRPGYFPGAAVVNSEMDNRTYGNLIIGGGIGLIVDASTGAWNQYPRAVRIRMTPQLGVGAMAGTGSVDFASRINAVERRAATAIATAQRNCARRRDESCVTEIEAIEARRNVERLALYADLRLRNPSSAVPAF
ncbi:hypothetical protein [Neoroseomonas lacus]|uniref:Uncharacterized protein n=1 Tax=Neoroseomonas lacus TaxID=287609 RepID=A0A917NNR7_9PROT|nr:hypothetical protein [Neoroseomonas lacus]GGJ14017.1 hypothetical protein GCM10011320_21600 [Neoroseomonas lacus]